jgi:peptidoglycan/xylan/chitin deacetylase (PgdA/CDA1 family)
MSTRRIIVGIPLVIILIVGAALTVAGLSHHSPAAAQAAPEHGVRLYDHAVTGIPVLAWHQIIGGVAHNTAEDILWNFNKDCKPTAAVCNSPNGDETVSLTQFSTELGWLKSQGYQSITSAQYYDWVKGITVKLPEKPILLTVDDGTLNSYTNTTAVLKRYNYNMITFIVSQFATGASNNKQPYAGWDATWSELLALPSAQWSFAFHAGAHGHNVTFPQNKACTYYYPCQLPTETDAQYQSRVSGEITQGRKTELQHLGSRLNTTMWAVPWNDLANQANLPSEGDARVWLAKWAATQFPVIFIQDATHNGYLHERYRLEIHGTWNEATFQDNVSNNVTRGFFNK